MSYRPTPECVKYAIPITTSTGKIIRVVPYETAQRFEAQRDELQEKYDILATENMLEVNKICNQRDAAIKELKEAWLAMDEIEGTDRINAWQNKNAHFLDTDI
jgi:hypothetical protein